MVSTIKMSQFAASNYNTPTNMLVGVSSDTGGVNIQQPVVTTWTTSTRPTMPYDGLMGYNTTLEAWEFFQGSSMAWVQFQDTSSGMNWTIVTAASATMASNSGYISNRSSTPVQLILPATFAIGDRIIVMGLGTAGWNIVCNTGQSAVFGSSSTSVSGGINSDIQYSNIELKGLVANTTWSVFSINSNPTII